MVESSELSYNDLQEEEVDDVIAFMAKHFYPREPLSTGLYMTYDDNKEWIHESARDWVRSGASVVARNPHNNELAGTILTTVLTRNQNTSFDEALNSPKIKVKTLHKVLSVLESSVNFFSKFSADKILELAMITVSDTFGGKGVGRRLVQESERRGVALGCQLATAQATAVPSQKLLERLGYESYFEMDYASFEIEGTPVFDMDKMLGTPSAKVMAKVLIPITPAKRCMRDWMVFKLSRSPRKSPKKQSQTTPTKSTSTKTTSTKSTSSTIEEEFIPGKPLSNCDG